jgi:hypothetical protein
MNCHGKSTATMAAKSDEDITAYASAVGVDIV